MLKTHKNAEELRQKRRTGFFVPALLLAAGVIVVAAMLLYAPDFPSSAEESSDGESESVFPLPERYADSYGNDWGARRVQGKHEGTDIFAPEGTAIRSITDGRTVRARGSDDEGWNDLGGYTVMVEASENVGPIKRGDFLYYAHMNGPSNFEIGEEVESGQKVGEVGDTGQGPEGTSGEFRPHLHVGWYEPRHFFGEARAKTDSGAMNPYPLLRWIERRSYGATNGGPPS